MRKEGWERLLEAHLHESSGFAWGERDCALWCAEWVRKATGNDLGTTWRGRYTTEAGAKRLMIRRGYDAPEEIADESLMSVPVPLARRGDIVLHPTQGCLGICNGVYSHFLTGEGPTRVETLACSRAWRV